MWIYDDWEELFTKEWEQAAKEAYESMSPAILGLSVEPMHSDSGLFEVFWFKIISTTILRFDMKKAGR